MCPPQRTETSTVVGEDIDSGYVFSERNNTPYCLKQ